MGLNKFIHPSIPFQTCLLKTMYYDAGFDAGGMSFVFFFGFLVCST